eukprot:Pgem_evm1s7346
MLNFSWDPNVVGAYDTLLLAIQSPVLQQPLPSVPFHLEVDASHVGIGGCLYQLNVDGSKRIIRLFSYGLKGAQMNWSAEKRELFAVKFGIEHLQEYLIGCFFHVHVDNQNYNQAITSMHSYALDCPLLRKNILFESENLYGGRNLYITVSQIVSNF